MGYTSERGWEELELLSDTPLDEAPSTRAFMAAAAAIEAVFETLGHRPFSYLEIDETTTNSDLDPGTTDTAFYASLAYAGREVWEPFAALEQGPPPRPEKRKEFWEWWLGEAIPAAWEAIGQERDE